ncbi:hypothetical protein ABIF99_004465 [Bradyrhizobium japonicum]
MIPSAAKTRNNHYVPQWHQEGFAQLTGSSIFTDSAYRWREIRGAIASKEARLAKLSSNFKSTTFQMPTTVVDAVNSIDEGATATYPALMADIFKYLLRANNSGMPKPNVEDRLAARFSRLHSTAQTSLGKKNGMADRFADHQRISVRRHTT